ncbi:MAG: diacylglycerol kinase family lipid kinase [Bacteroidales bacterium]|nr:diacylglycerol kinase family lipid kinase [Bacteroidales bacterium]
MALEWLVIVNPNAGRRKGERDWLKIASLLTEAGFHFKNIFTQHRNHAMHETVKHIENGHKKIIVVGGDGTLNEVVNGVFKQKHFEPLDITIGMIPVGTGNDWCRMFNVPYNNYKGAVEIIKRGNTFVHDACKVRYFENGKKIIRYFINMAGMGYDAVVAQKTNKQKEEGKGGAFSYAMNIFSSLFDYQNMTTTVEIDGEQYDYNVFSISVGINKYNGGGMKQSPKAIPNDGLLNVVVVTKVTKMEVIRHAKKLYDGSHLSLPQVKHFTCKKAAVRSEGELRLETDGESIGLSPFEFEIVPASLNMLIGDVKPEEW